MTQLQTNEKMFKAFCFQLFNVMVELMQCG